MTMMDEVWRDQEQASAISAKQLQIWLATIAPVRPDTAKDVQFALNRLAMELRWETKYDSQLGVNLIKTGNENDKT